MMQKAEERFSNKLIYVNFALAVLIVITHTYCTDFGNVNAASWQNTAARFSLNLFQGHICQVAVPCFFAISGFLFYRNFTFGKLLTKWRSRIRSLVIPYLFWNTITYLFYVAISNWSLTNRFLQMEPIRVTWSGLLNGVFLHSYSVLWFVKVLIFFVALAPIFALLLKRKSVAVVAELGFIALSLFYPHKSTNSLLYTASFYFLGAYAGTFAKEKVINLQSKKTAVVSLVVLFGSLAITMLWENSYFFYFFKLIWAGTLWFAFDLCSDYTAPPIFCRMSFFIYCTHEFFIRAIEKVIWNLHPNGILINIAVTILGTVFGVCLLGYLLKRFVPRTWRFVNGGRG